MLSIFQLNIKRTIKIFVILLIVLLCLPSQSDCQQRISDVRSEGDNSRYILKETDGERYLLSIDKFDVLKVERFIGTDLEHLHSRTFEGLQFEHEYYTTDHFLIFEDVSGGIAYNFVTNEVKLFPFPDDFIRNEWNFVETLNDETVLSQNPVDFSSRIVKYIDLANDYTIPLQSGYATRQSSHFVYQQNHSQDDFSKHIFINKETQEVDSVSIFAIRSWQTQVDSIYHIYIDNNKVYHRNLITKEIQQIYQITDVNIYSSVIVLDEVYAVRVVIQGAEDKIVLINKTDLQVRSTIQVGSVDEIYPQISNNQLIYHDWIYVVVHDLDTDTKVELHSQSVDNKHMSVIDDQFLVYPDEAWVNGAFGGAIGVYDLQNGDSHKLSSSLDPPYNKLEHLKISNHEVLLNFEDPDDDRLNLFELNLENIEAKESTDYKKSINGLPEESQILKVNNDLLLYAKDDIYHVVGKDLVKLNANPIYDFYILPYVVSEDYITWVEKISFTQYRLVKFENGNITLSEEIDLQNLSSSNTISFSSYSISASNRIFVVISDFSLGIKLYEIVNGQYVFVSNLDNTLAFGPFPISHGNNLYLQQPGKVLVFDDSNVKTELNLEGGFLGYNFFKFQERLYFDAQDGLYEFNGINANLVVAYEDSVPFRIGILSEDIVTVAISPTKSGVLDNASVTEIDGIEVINFDHLGEDYLEVLEPFASNIQKSSIYNIANATTYELPDSIALQNLVKVVPNGSETLLITTDGFSTQSEVNVYLTNSSFSNFVLVSNFASSNTWANAEFSNLGIEGFLYADDQLLLMDNQYGFHTLSVDIVGDPNTVNIIEKNSFFYFIAISEEFGRQLYRVITYSQTGTSVVEKVLLPTSVFPNPVSNSFKISTEDEAFINSKLVLTDVSGKQVGMFRIDNVNDEVEVSGLANGIYVYSIIGQSGKLISAGRFVKL